VTRVIKNHEGFYLKQGGGWTTYYNESEKFNDANSALLTAQNNHLHHVDLILVLSEQPESEWDVVLPLWD
jgi:hypothetical protein